MISTTWGPHVYGRTAWALPDDLWGTLVAAQRLVHLQLGGLYTPPTGLISFPGTAVILVPVVALIDVAGTPLVMQSATNPYPASWLLAGPYEIAISGVALFAADALAERLGAPWPRRALLALAGAVALWSVTARWGHPEDAVAVGLLLYGTYALADGRTGRAGWLAGAAIAVQPLVLLAVPVLLVVVAQDASGGRARRVLGFCVRAALPAALALGVAAAANWHATVIAVTAQPNSPVIDHPTPWTSLTPKISPGGEVAAASGPGRILALCFACGCAVAYARWRGTREQRTGGQGTREQGIGECGPGESLADLLWWMAAALAMRSVFESVMVAYYVWPVLQVALVAASVRTWRLFLAGLAAAGVTLAAQLSWHGAWGWWSLMLAGLAVVLALAWRVPAPDSRVDGDQAAVGEVRPGLRGGVQG
jgi:hypothetical protein